MSRASGVSGDFPVQLATRLPDLSAVGLLRCIVLPVCQCPCVVSFSKFHEPDTHDLLLHPRSILVRHVRHVRFPRDMLATSSKGCHEDATRKLLPWNFGFTERDAAGELLKSPAGPSRRPARRAPWRGQASAHRRRRLLLGVYQGHMRLVPGSGSVDDSPLIMAFVKQ